MTATTFLQATGLALIPTLVWGYFFVSRNPESRRLVLVTFLMGTLAVIPLLLFMDELGIQLQFHEKAASKLGAQGASGQIAEKLGITAPPFRIDSQCKYAAVARGQATIYLRLPKDAVYREKIWDHAAGQIVVEEAGGRVTDVTGKALDFSRGQTLADNRGVIVTNGPLHDRVVEVVGEVLNAG